MPSTVVAPKFASETRTDTFDFSPYIAAGQSISAVATTVSVYYGTDPSPSAVVSSATYSGLVISIAYGSGVVGTIYNVLIKATLTGPAGSVVMQYFLAVIPDAV